MTRRTSATGTKSRANKHNSSIGHGGNETYRVIYKVPCTSRTLAIRPCTAVSNFNLVPHRRRSGTADVRAEHAYPRTAGTRRIHCPRGRWGDRDSGHGNNAETDGNATARFLFPDSRRGGGAAAASVRGYRGRGRAAKRNNAD